MSTPIVAAIHRLTATWADAPRIVTVTRKPAAGLFTQFFGAAATHNVILGDDGVAVKSGDATEAFADIAAAAATIREAAGDALILRFVDPATIRLVEADAPDLIDAAAALWLQIRDEAVQARVRAEMAARGFVHAIVSEMPPAEFLARVPVKYDAAPDYAAAAAVRMETLVLLDNNLTGERGHYLSVAARIAAGAQQAGVRMIWATNARLDPALAAKGVEIEPVFATSIFDIDQDAQATIDLSAEIAEAWAGLLDRYDAPGTHFLVPTSDGHFIRAVHRLLAGRDIAGAIHLATPYETRHMPSRQGGRELDWYLGAISRHPAFNRRVFLWGETIVLSALLAERLGADVRALPLPAPAWALETEMAGLAGPFTIVFLGEARLDKGSLELPGIVTALLAGAAPGTIRVMVQLVPPFGGYDDDLAEAIARLRAIHGVEIIDGVLSDADYRTALLAAHAVLLPYRAENYAVRGSGILIEALAAGRIVLSSPGTVAEEYAGEGIVALCAEPGDWTEAIREILDDRQAIQRQAWRLGKRFCRRYAPRGYLDRLAARVEFA